MSDMNSSDQNLDKKLPRVPNTNGESNKLNNNITSNSKVGTIKDEIFQTKNESTGLFKIIKDCINYLDVIDKAMSKPLHRYSPGFKVECIFYFFARIYNVDTVIIYLVSIFLYSLIKLKNGYIVLIPLYHILIGVFFTVLLKKVVSRPRPIPERKRRFKIKESNHSMPSGDSLQAGNVAVMMIIYFKSPYKYLSILLIPGVMAGRVFYNLHYWFDCIVGLIIGVVVCILSYCILNFYISIN